MNKKKEKEENKIGKRKKKKGRNLLGLAYRKFSPPAGDHRAAQLFRARSRVRLTNGSRASSAVSHPR
jgi:hypothetical protein